MKTQLCFLFIGGMMLSVLSGCSSVSSENVYIERLGTDTLSAETYTMGPDEFHGQLMNRMPVTQVVTYDANLNDDGSITNMHVNWKTPSENPKGPKPRFYTISINDTTAQVSLRGDWRGKNIDTTYQMTVPSGSVPGLGGFAPTAVIFNQIIRQANLKSSNQSYSTHIISPGSKRLVPVALRRLGGDTLALKMHGETYLATVNAKKIINWYSGRETTVRTNMKPAPGANFSQMASMFAARDARGNGMPIASPLDSAKTVINGAHLKIVYSRPSKRGRVIWGKLVPWNMVWRTGANAATSFSTDKDIMIGDTKIPAGSYTLYSIYTPTSAKLIVNSQTGQWGTVYNQDRDFARIPMEKTTVEPHEMFTISFDTVGNKHELNLVWDTSAYHVAIQ